MLELLFICARIKFTLELHFTESYISRNFKNITLLKMTFIVVSVKFFLSDNEFKVTWASVLLMVTAMSAYLVGL